MRADRLLIDHGDVITSGGATTFLDLALDLVEPFAGRERANAAARVLLIDGARTSQLPHDPTALPIATMTTTTWSIVCRTLSTMSWRAHCGSTTSPARLV